MAILTIPGGGKALNYSSEAPGPAVTMAGTSTYWNWFPDHTGWPTAHIHPLQENAAIVANAYRDYRTDPVPPAWFPQANSHWIWYSWDLNWLTTLYGPPVSRTTTVTIPVIGVISNGTHFQGQPWLSGLPTARDLLACVPAAVQRAEDLQWHDADGSIIAPNVNNVEWSMLSHDITGGTLRFPARPFPNVIGPGGWTQLGSYHTDDNIQPDLASNTFPGAGTWVVPVDLTTHARDGHLVIVCAGLGQFTQNEALLTEAQSYDGNPPVGTTEFLNNETWNVSSRAQLLWNAVPPTPEDLGVEGRAHFFRGGPGEIPLGVAGEVDSSGAGGP